ncbi:single-stranded DNA-binding protein [Alteromonas gilva]|uniref:Single-stranded DNA-binding protein n=1 Tax=Alteromonas gilva TaxID=2987522 RepID=A0ABT5L6Z9_9ALTE|nr:single-stranded DNA-binding protein [Alteromonas gilva]MDC8832814.1 single-stranded DNA-binding protein [Alteromonas gilva]
MSFGFIEVLAVGNIGEISPATLPSGDAVTNFTFASTKYWKDKQGQQQEKTTWVRCKAFGKTGELISQLATVGTEMMLKNAELTINKWKDSNGVKRETPELIVSEFRVLSRGKKSESYQNQSQQQASAQPNAPQQQQPVTQQQIGSESAERMFNQRG